MVRSYLKPTSEKLAPYDPGLDSPICPSENVPRCFVHVPCLLCLASVVIRYSTSNTRLDTRLFFFPSICHRCTFRYIGGKDTENSGGVRLRFAMRCSAVGGGSDTNVRSRCALEASFFLPQRGPRGTTSRHCGSRRLS